jgi:hypothetical protein
MNRDVAFGSTTDQTGGVRECPDCDPEADFAAKPSERQRIATTSHREDVE